MVNATVARCGAVLLLAGIVLTAAAALRSAEYDEQYTLFLTAGVARPAWPATPFRAGTVQRLQAGHGSMAGIARDLRATDVHPPLYFWTVALWRRAFGGSLFAARMLSVICGLLALAAVGGIAACAGIPPALAMLLTLGCYGFAYTAAIARGFALAQALTLAGVLALQRAQARRGPRLLGGVLLGAATASNYLAVFAAAAVVGMFGPASGGRGVRDEGPLPPSRSRHGGPLPPSRSRHGGPLPPSPSRKGRGRSLYAGRCVTGGILWSALGFAPWLALDFWFFLPQRGSRVGQFPPFHLADALHRLAACTAADLLGGLPLYVATGMRPLLSAGCAGLLLGLATLVAVRWRDAANPQKRWLLAAALATPLGLMLLGVAFDSTPMELRYLAFATPFAALLLAGALSTPPHRPGATIAATVLAVQAIALAGLLLRPETMQPARATAQAVAPLAADALVLVPRGNDGVGIVGAFALESPSGLKLLVVARGMSPAQIRHQADGARRVVLALLAQDAASRATLPQMRAAFATPCWRRVTERSNLAAFERVCDGE